MLDCLSVPGDGSHLARIAAAGAERVLRRPRKRPLGRTVGARPWRTHAPRRAKFGADGLAHAGRPFGLGADPWSATEGAIDAAERASRAVESACWAFWAGRAGRQQGSYCRWPLSPHGYCQRQSTDVFTTKTVINMSSSHMIGQGRVSFLFSLSRISE